MTLPPEEQITKWVHRLANDDDALKRLRDTRGWSADALLELRVGLNDAGRLVFPIRDADDKLIGVVTRNADGGDSKTPSGHKRGAFPAPEDVRGDDLYVVEGEADAVAGVTIGLPTVSIPGTAGMNAALAARIAARRRRVVIITDADKQGRDAAEKWARAIADAGCGDVRIVDLSPDANDHSDLNDAVRAVGEPHELRLRISELADRAVRIAGKGGKRRRELTSVPIKGMRFAQVHWLWRQYVALGKITVLAGLAGQGKSQLTCMMASLATRGWADAPAGDVLIVSGEDDPRDTIAPRLIAAGADPMRVHLLDAREHNEDGTVTPGILSMPDDARGLYEAVERLPAPRLLILDPVTAFLSSGADSYKNADVRRALGPLKNIAERFGVAVVLVTHLNKSQGVEPLVRIADSGAFTALARGVLLMASDPEDEDGDRGSLKTLAVAKSNIADTGEHSLRFRITPTRVTDEYDTTVEVASLVLVGNSSLSAADLLTPSDQRHALQEARIYLRDALADGPLPGTSVKKGAMAEGIAEATLRRAREIECAAPRRAQGVKHGPWLWALRRDAGLLAHARVESILEQVEPIDGLHAQDGQDNGHARANGAPPPPSNTDYLRERDRRLGESWDDD